RRYHRAPPPRPTRRSAALLAVPQASFKGFPPSVASDDSASAIAFRSFRDWASANPGSIDRNATAAIDRLIVGSDSFRRALLRLEDRKSTRLNSSHEGIS